MLDFLRLLLNLHVHEGAWPQKQRQRCIECGMSRSYALGREKQGKWERDRQEQKHQQVYVLKETQ